MLDSRYLRYGFMLTALVPVALMFPLCVKAEPLPTNEVPPLEVAVDPYAGVGWATVRQAKANLHTHSTQSDGSLEVSAVIDAYHALDYEVLAMTDHNKVTWPWSSYGRDPATLGMVAVQGNELSRHHHANSLFCGFTTGSTDLETSLAGVAAAQGIALLNHPAYHWPASHPPVTAAVRVPMAPALRAMGQGDFTVETWFRTTKADRNILMGNYSTSYSGSLTLELHTENRARVYFQPTTGTLTDLNVSATTLGIDTRDGQWHHLAAARTGTTLRLFLDGQLLGEAAAAQPGFDLQGEYFYLGRDTRTGSTQLVGALDQSRLWARALAPAEIAALAAGSATAGLAQGATGLLAEYRFETSGGTPVAPAPSFTGTIDDSAGHPQGPFHASASGGETLAVTDQVPAPLLATSQSRHALQFATASGVPASALAYYRDLFLRHPVVFGMEVLNGTRPLSEYTLDRNLWDGLLGELMPHRPVWGMANDDMHSTTHLGRDWAVLLTSSLDEATVRACLENGRYYFSSTRVKPAGSTSNEPPPRIDSIVHDATAGRMTLSASVNGMPLPASAYQWISHGRVVHTGPVIDYRTDGLLPAGARYLRAEVQGEGGITLTNPVGFAPAPNDEEIHAGDLREGLIAYYDFEETGAAGLANKAPGASGFNATRHGGGVFDSSAHPSGHGFSGNATFNPGNGESDRSELLVGNALNLVDTRGDAIIVPLAHTNLGDNFTISVWHALTPSGGSVARPFVFEQADNNYNISWGIGSGDSYTAYVTAASAVGGGVLARDAWHHAAHVFESDGTTTISEGSLQLGDGGATGSPGPGAIVNNAALEIIRSDALALANIISGSGTLAIKGGGTVTLTGTNTYTGDTTVEDGTLILGSGGQLSFALTGTSTSAVGGPGEAIFNGLSRLDLTAAELADGTAWTLVSAAVRTYGATFSLTSNAGPFGRSGGVHTLFTGGRTWTFDEATGTLSVNDGINLANGASLKMLDGTEVGAGALTLNGGNLWLGEGVDVSNEIELVGPAGRNVFGGTLDLPHGLTDAVAELWINGIQQPAGTYHSGNTGGVITGTGSIRVTGTTGGFAAWIGGFFPGETDPAIIGPDADPNGDGVANALVYLFGGDPKDGNNRFLLPTAVPATNPGGPVPAGDYLVFTCRRDAVAQVTAAVEHSATLAAPWTTATHGVDGVVIVETPNSHEPGINKVEVFIPRSDERLFGRLGATLP